MTTRTNINSNRILIGTALLACTLCAGIVCAKEPTVTVALHVSTQGVDLSQPAGARTFYTRLENAAWVACTRGNRVDLVPVTDLKGCYEKALGGAVRATRSSLVTQLYLTTHTYAEAAARGIEIPSQVAGR